MLTKQKQNQILGTRMEKEIKKPFIKRPDFSKPDQPSYDYRNYECAGQFRGVGQAGKVGLINPQSIDPMPPENMKIKVPRDHEG